MLSCNVCCPVNHDFLEYTLIDDTSNVLHLKVCLNVLPQTFLSVSVQIILSTSRVGLGSNLLVNCCTIVQQVT